MTMNQKRSRVGCSAALASLLGLSFASTATADITITGRVVDLNGAPLPQAMVTVDAAESHAGADVITVFTDQQGLFRLPEPVRDVDSIRARMLEYEELDQSSQLADGASDVTIVMRRRTNQADVAPASAWLAGMSDREEKAFFVRDCITCHQVPSSNVRNYAKLIAAVESTDPAEVRRQSWHSIVQYMNYLWGWEFGRADPAGPPEPEGVYSVSDGDEVAAIMAKHFIGPMDELSGYDYGAPLIVNENTLIKEYEVSGTNAIREAVLLGESNELWMADVSSNRMYAVDVTTGLQRHLEVPAERMMGPHSLHRGSDGSLWVTPFFSSVVARFDPAHETWQTWDTTTINGESVGIHDLSFGYEHELLTDDEGRIWYSDIDNNAVGYLDPKTGNSEIFRMPDVPGRSDRRAVAYGLVMTSDRKQVWYSQLGIGAFGNFNIETQEFETSVQLPSVNAGPRRLTISDDDIMYVPLYGSGQLVEYDTKTRKEIGTYDLPDTGSAPYAATWDPVRRVVWIPTSNADVIYRFDPRTKAFGVIPLPRAGAFLRMLDIDPETGMLISAYGNIVEFVHGPRMAVMVDPGDGAYASSATEHPR
jgi:streptogramin lyase